MNGKKDLPMRPHYGVKNSSNTNNLPGGRKDAASWHAPDGTTWVFGGYGFAGNEEGYLNDLWKYNPAENQWTWMAGDQQVNTLGSYGTLGMPSPSNYPGARRGSVSWMGPDGNFYLLGGEGFSSSGEGRLNDLWRLNTMTLEWTWIGGSNQENAVGVYGLRGVENAANWPGARNDATIWNTPNSIYLFGGSGLATTQDVGHLNDLWKYDMNSGHWSWISGSNTIDATTLSNLPGGRSGSAAWQDAGGALYLFGGISGYVAGPTSTNPAGTYLNELWRFDPLLNQWVLLKGGSLTGNNAMYGTQGAFAPANQPGRRSFSFGWTDAAGIFWLYGGRGHNLDYFTILNDLWKYDPSTNQWAWVKGDNAGDNFYGSYGEQMVTSPMNEPGSRASGIAWTDASGRLWSYGGYIYTGAIYSLHNDTWNYDPATNLHTWVKGDTSFTVKPVYGSMGVASPANRPGERRGPGTWKDNAGNLWLFGGDIRNPQDGPPARATNDLWKYNPLSNQWTWIKGGPGFEDAVYGTQGIAATNNRPGQRENAKTWTDASGNFWLFGGYGMLGNNSDLWKYNPSTNEWTWMKGSSSTSYAFNDDAFYDVKGTPGSTNQPGRRQAAANWVDNDGNAWLFGGSGRNTQYINDLWKYNPSTNQWTWMHGGNTINQPGIYGTKGVATPSNTPGARDGSATWKDNAGNLWLFGGEVIDFSGNAYHNDLWKFDPTNNQWTWVHGETITNRPGSYGDLGSPNASNSPGSRSRPVTWTDGNGNFWMFGGRGYDANGNFGELNDCWMFNPNTNEWTWMKGDALVGVNGIYGNRGVPAASNKPGGRYGAAAWLDGTGDVWIYGGSGLAEMGRDRLSDLWKISSATMAPLPVQILEFNGHLVEDDAVLKWTTGNEQAADRFLIERSLDGNNFEEISQVQANNQPGRQQYQYIDRNIWQQNSGVVYYRLKQVDIDGSFAYSRIIALQLKRSLAINFYPNPVISHATLSITTDKAGPATARIIGQSGAIVRQYQWRLAQGSQLIQLDLTNLAAGIYFLDLQGEKEGRRVRFVK